MDLCWQSDVSAFSNTIWVCLSFPSKELVSFHFMAVVTVYSDFGAHEIKPVIVCIFLHLFAMKLRNWMP